MSSAENLSELWQALSAQQPASHCLSPELAGGWGALADGEGSYVEAQKTRVGEMEMEGEAEIVSVVQLNRISWRTRPGAYACYSSTG